MAMLHSKRMRHMQVSIQLLLLFYERWSGHDPWSWSVSIQLLLLFYMVLVLLFLYCKSFNTTLVTVLYTHGLGLIPFPLFQYNSCYCSIFFETGSFFTSFEFQYNSCYCSIFFKEVTKEKNFSFNTTLVTVLYTGIL